MLIYEKNIQSSKQPLIISFDLEWTKNYKIKNGNQPFCFSFVFFPLELILSTVEKQLEFGFYSRYVENKEDICSLVNEADRILGSFLDSCNKAAIVGHQLSSDISVVLNCSLGEHKTYFVQLKNLWQTRKQDLSEKKNLEIFDSRYDLEGLLKEKSRRLVDVCEECNLIVEQPEISSSMTKMQNDFYASGDRRIMEKLSVLNIRHSLSAAILFLMSREKCKAKKVINVNRIIYRNLGQFDYVRGEEFKKLL